MAEQNNAVLNLDEVLEGRRKIQVRRQGAAYDFIDLSSMSASNVIKIQTMRQKIARLQMLDEISDEQAQNIEKLFDGILSLLCPTLPVADIAYTEKTTILAFYFTESQAKKARSPKTE